MQKRTVVQKALEKVKSLHSGESSGHDYWHSFRVWQMARRLAREEGRRKKIDTFVVELAAILHDIADYKLNNGDDTLGPRRAGEFLRGMGGISEEEIGKVQSIISEMNFPGTARKNPRMSSLEGEIVRDSDFLDAMGAIGIARTFAYGGGKSRSIYEPSVKPKLRMSKEEYRARGHTHTINHFYEKLLRLKEILGTPSARRIARVRHERMERFLKDFHSEWEGKS